MKKLILALMVVFLLAGSSQAVYADVVVEPDNTFFDKYYTYMVPLDREFIVNGEAGYTQAQSAPNKQNVIGTFQNGHKCYITYSCLYDGEYWGISYIGEIGYGWFRMDDLLVLYDETAFEKEHAAAFYDYTGGMEEILEAGSVIIWEWPGSGVTLYTLDIFEGDNFSISRAYTDGNGLEWGYLDFFGRGGWVCVSDPMNYDLPALDPMPAPAKWVPGAGHKDISAAEKSGSPVLLIVIIVAALVAGTVLLIKLLYDPKKKSA